MRPGFGSIFFYFGAPYGFFCIPVQYPRNLTDAFLRRNLSGRWYDNCDHDRMLAVVVRDQCKWGYDQSTTGRDRPKLLVFNFACFPFSFAFISGRGLLRWLRSFSRSPSSLTLFRLLLYRETSEIEVWFVTFWSTDSIHGICSKHMYTLSLSLAMLLPLGIIYLSVGIFRCRKILLVDSTRFGNLSSPFSYYFCRHSFLPLSSNFSIRICPFLSLIIGRCRRALGANHPVCCPFLSFKIHWDSES